MTTPETDDRPAHRARALDLVRTLILQLRAHPVPDGASGIVELGEHLERAIQAFHMEAIRFRMYSLDRALKQAAPSMPAEVGRTFEAVRSELEAAGFHTRSH